MPVVWDEGPPWRFAVRIRRDESAAGHLVDGWFAREGERGTERLEITTPLLVLADGILVTYTAAARLDHGNAFDWLAALRRTPLLAVPETASLELFDALLRQPPPLVEAPAELRVEVVDGTPRPRLRVAPDRARADRLLAEVSFDYEGTIVEASARRPIVRATAAARAIRRDLAAEQRHVARLERLGCRWESAWQYGPEKILRFPRSRPLVGLVTSLLGEGWHVEADGHAYRVPGTPTLAVRSGIDWFELHGRVPYGDVGVDVPDLLAALEGGHQFVSFNDGSVGLLPEEWLRRYAAIARFGTQAGDHVRFQPTQAALLDALLEAQPAVEWDDAFARAKERLRDFDGIRPLDPASTFVGELRGYQRDGLGWFAFLERLGFGGCLADDMGLGKTVMVLALLDARCTAQTTEERRPSLVVVPRSLVWNWKEEARRFTPRLRVLDYSGPAREELWGELASADLVLTTYGTLRRDAARLAGFAFDYAVLDEAQAIKNAQTASAKACRLLQARHRLALSGTPIENHLGELGSLFEFLNPGLLGKTAYAKLARAGAVDEAQLAILARAVRPFILRRTKEQVAAELPARTEQTILCELEPPQRVLYDQLLAHYRRVLLERIGTQGLERSKLQILEALLRLRQAACHPGLIDRARIPDPSAKLDVLVPRLLEAIDEGHKTLVFSQFTSLLAILRERLDEEKIVYEYLDGRTRDRASRVARFQTEADCPLFLISLKAGGLGLNLTAAEYVFLLDPWWNPAVEAQAIDRAHRIGQSRRVFAYRLIARDTVEERVLELQARKRKVAEAILHADASLIRDLRREDLELLLS
jgi:superfamily II DNA or RNA helicase